MPPMSHAPTRASTFATTAVLFVLVAACGTVFGIPGTRDFGRKLIQENGPVEMTTFFAFMAGGVIALVAAWKAGRTAETRALVPLLVAFGIAWMFAGMEEISWGQSLIGFSSPAGTDRFNVQNETNVHNLEGVQGLHSFLLFLLGAGGLVAAAVIDRGRHQELRPPGSTRACFGAVAILGLFDWITDNFPFGSPADTVIGMLAEVNEMILSIAGLLFAIALARRMAARARDTEGAAARPSVRA